jgi:AhpD family alkylhydroperoxidase
MNTHVATPAELSASGHIKRINPFQVSPDAVAPLIALEKQIAESGLEHSLIELVKMRASQINGCAFCLHMHAKDARAAGETEMRLYLLSAWEESSFYTERERAALGWTEALTKIAETHAPDSAYAAVAGQFGPEELIQLTLLITTINAWNRLAIGFRLEHPKAR